MKNSSTRQILWYQCWEVWKWFLGLSDISPYLIQAPIDSTIPFIWYPCVDAFNNYTDSSKKDFGTGCVFLINDDDYVYF